jgi:hypothetical protein
MSQALQRATAVQLAVSEALSGSTLRPAPPVGFPRKGSQRPRPTLPVGIRLQVSAQPAVAAVGAPQVEGWNLAPVPAGCLCICNTLAVDPKD